MDNRFDNRIAKMTKTLLLFYVLFWVASASLGVHGMHSTGKDLGLERQLELTNINSSIKSIHTKFGYIIDCIEINKQLSLEHPLLKNHQLQREPSFQMTSREIPPTKLKFGLEKETCPKGTVPIRRITKDDLIQAKALVNNNQNSSDESYVADVVATSGGPYYGVKGISRVYNPRVSKDQTSESHIWVQNGHGDGINKIIVGWHVSPRLYGDNATHFFSRWTSDNFKKTGCYNILCPGFVQTNGDYQFGGTIDTSFTKINLELRIDIYEDPIRKNWWVAVFGKAIGYFPGALFSNLTSADQVGWGGGTTTSTGSPPPPMGSGNFPSHKAGRECYIKQLSFVHIIDRSLRLDYPDEVETINDRPKCYGVKYVGDTWGQFRYSLQFGGPGGVCSNSNQNLLFFHKFFVFLLIIMGYVLGF